MIYSAEISNIDEIKSIHDSVIFLENSTTDCENHESIKKAVNNLKQMDLQNIQDDKVIIHEIIKFAYIPYFVTTLHPGKFIFRARPNKGGQFDKVDDLSFVPDS